MSINQQLSAVGTHTHNTKHIHTHSFLCLGEWYIDPLSACFSLKCVLNRAGKWLCVTWTPLLSPRGFLYFTHTRLSLFDSTDISTSQCFLGPSATCRHIPASCRQLSQASAVTTNMGLPSLFMCKLISKHDCLHGIFGTFGTCSIVILW